MSRKRAFTSSTHSLAIFLIVAKDRPPWLLHSAWGVDETIHSREIFANDGHKSYSDIYPLPLWTSLCICDGDRIDSWQQTPPSVFPPPDTWAVSAPEIREPLLSVWLCNLLSDELSPTWMCSPVLKRCIVGDASAVSITANHFVTGIKSWTWALVYVQITSWRRRILYSSPERWNCSF